MRLHWHHVHAGGRGLRKVAIAATLAVASLEIGGQILLPLLASHPQWVEYQLSHATRRQIRFASLHGHWEMSGPRFVMHQVSARLADGGQPLLLDEAILKLDFGGWMPGRHFINLYGRGLSLDLSRDRNGDWQINGIGIAGHQGEQRTDFGHLAIGLWFEDLEVNITDHLVGKRYTLIADAMRLQRVGDEIKVGARLHRSGARGSIVGAGRFDVDGKTGRVWVSAGGVNLHSLLAGFDLNGYEAESGNGQGATWLDWTGGRVIRAETRFDFSDLALSNAESRRSVVPAIHGLAVLQRVGSDGYAARWQGDDGSLIEGMASISDGAASALKMRASDVELAPLVPWVALIRGLPDAAADWFGQGAPRGRIKSATVNWSRSGGLSSAYVDFDHVAIRAFGAAPGIDSLHGIVRADKDAASVELPAQAATLDLPHLYAQPLRLNQWSATLAAWRDQDGWHIGVDPLQVAGDGFGGQVRGQLDCPAKGGFPIADFYAKVDDMDVETVKRLFPLTISSHARDWLGKALTGGRLTEVSALVHGSMADWPFDHQQGRFEAHARLDDLVLNYGEAWPQVTAVAGDLSFINDGLHVEAGTASTLGIAVTKANLDIPRFKDGVLDLQVQAQAAAADGLNFVTHSPVASRQAASLSHVHLDGQMGVDLHLVMPLKDRQNFQLDGSGNLVGGRLSAPEWNLDIQQMQGPLHFDRGGFTGGPMQAQFHQQPATVQLSIGQATGDPDRILSATLQGRFTIPQLTEGYSMLSWLNPLSTGTAPFQLGFDISRGADGGSQQSLHLESSLQGIALQLPAPLNKPAASSLPLALKLALPVQGGNLDVALGNLLQGRLRLPNGPASDLAGSLHLGTEAPTALPPRGLRITGRSDILDATGWAAFAAASKGGHDGPQLESVDVSAASTKVFGTSLQATRIKVRPEPSQFHIEVDGPAVLGSIGVPSTELDKRGLTVRLQRLYWPRVEMPPASSATMPAAAATLAADRASGSSTANTAALASDSTASANPANLPPLHLWIHDLHLGAARLGEVRLEGWHIPGGLRIDPIQTLSSEIQISGSADWLGDAAANHSQVKLRLAAKNLGDMLASLGYPHIFDGGETQLHLNASWPGSPLTPDLSRAEGELALDIQRGNIPQLPPGAGARVLGLVSVFELPRRLSFDFNDVFNKGLGFDAIKGHFQLTQGSAVTRDLRIDSPAANVQIRGRAGLSARDYDEAISVVPHIGNSLPVAGAVFGGPIGIAAGLVAQGLFGQQINHAMIKRYHLAGSWDKPWLTPLSAASAGAPASAGDPAPDPARNSSHGL